MALAKSSPTRMPFQITTPSAVTSCVVGAELVFAVDFIVSADRIAGRLVPSICSKD